MKKLLKIPVFMGIPFILSQWTPLNIEIKGSPKVSVENTQLTIRTEKEAGGFAYFLKNSVGLGDGISALKWNWMIEEFPSAKPTIPFKKAEEDFALRVGFLFSDGNFNVPLPGAMRKEFVKRKQSLSYVLFYCASSAEVMQLNSERCGKSPYHKNITNCLSPASQDNRGVTVEPFRDLKKLYKLSSQQIRKTKLVGIWLFADSDNSSSKSSAKISDIEMIMRAPSAGVIELDKPVAYNLWNAY